LCGGYATEFPYGASRLAIKAPTTKFCEAHGRKRAGSANFRSLECRSTLALYVWNFQEVATLRRCFHGTKKGI
jgi:hypothetical protein